MKALDPVPEKGGGGELREKPSDRLGAVESTVWIQTKNSRHPIPVGLHQLRGVFLLAEMVCSDCVEKD